MANKRRGKNEGSIHKRENGTWRAQITIQGRKISHTARTYRECQDWIRKTRDQIDNGLTFDGTKLSVKEYLQDWLVSLQASWSRSTFTHYEHLVRTYISPQIGNFPLKDLRPDHVQSLYTLLGKKGTGTYSIIKIHTLLHRAFQDALKTGILPRNPAAYTHPPKRPVKEMSILNDSQISAMLANLIGHRWEALYHLAVVTGMRQMEILGLKWDDLDWIKQSLKVERQLARPNDDGEQFSALKTRYSKRSVALGDRTIKILREHYNRQQVARQKAGDKWVEHGLIFTTDNGTPIHPRNLLKDFHRLLEDTGLPPIRFHDLRHTAASLMLNNGVPVIVVSRRLGHAKASITLDIYGHLMPGMQEEAANLMDELVSPVELPIPVTDKHQ